MTVPPPLATLDASEPLEKIYDAIARDGGVIVKDFLSAELLEDFMAAIEPHMRTRTSYSSKATHNELGDGFFPEGSLRVYGLLGKIPDQLCKVMRHPIWQGVMGKFLSDQYFSYTGQQYVPQKSGYMLGSTAALRLVPGAKPQPLHRDQLAYQTRMDLNNPLFTPMLGCLIAGSRCTKKNGATAVIPGSHLWPHDRIPYEHECTFAEMEAGSALFTLGSTYHGAGANNSEPTDEDALRTIFAVFGQRDYFRQDQEEILSTPIEIARKFPEDILRLAGYYKALGGVGYVEDHQSAAEFLQADSGLGSFVPPSVKVAL